MTVPRSSALEGSDRPSPASSARAARSLRLSSADNESARTLAAEIGRAAVVAGDNRDALQGADAVVLALRFPVLEGVIDEIADPLTDKLVVVPSNPVGTRRTRQRPTSPAEGQSSGEVVAGWLPAGARLAMAFGTMSADLFESSSNRSPELAVLFYATDDDRAGEEVERLIRTAGFEPREGRRDRTVGSTRGGRRPSRSRRRPRRGAVIARSGPDRFAASAGRPPHRTGVAPWSGTAFWKRPL